MTTFAENLKTEWERSISYGKGYQTKDEAVQLLFRIRDGRVVLAAVDSFEEEYCILELVTEYDVSFEVIRYADIMSYSFSHPG